MQSSAAGATATTADDPRATGPSRHRFRLAAYAPEVWCYLGAVVLGSVLIVAAAIRQPFSYDELQQLSTYDSSDPGTITSATRQPPIDPLLGAFFHHLFGQGQLQDRLVPALSGIGGLIVMSLLLRRLGLRYAGAAAMLVMATAPMWVRYSAYSRPYALPMLAMIAMAYFVTSWLVTGRRGFLWAMAVVAVALPNIRVPEPSAYLGVMAAVMWWYGHRGLLTKRQTRPVMWISLLALASMGIAQFMSLSESANAYFDPSLSGVIDRFPTGVHELVTAFVPLMGESFPWWPFSLLIVIGAFAVAGARRQLLQWPVFWPLLAAPVAFALAYHFVNQIPFDVLPYRARAASFFVLPFVLLVAALASVVERGGLDRRLRIGAGVLIGAVLVTQVPATVTAVKQDAAPDFGVVSGVITSQVPDDAIVLYDRPTPAGSSRQPFLGTWRYMGDTPFTDTATYVPHHLDRLPQDGPVYLVFNGQCAYHGRCVPGELNAVTGEIKGWHNAYQQERFTLYAPDDGTPGGREGVIRAMLATRQMLGIELGYVQSYVAATLLADEGKQAEAKAVLDQMFADAKAADPDLVDQIRKIDDWYELDPFDLDPHGTPSD